MCVCVCDVFPSRRSVVFKKFSVRYLTWNLSSSVPCRNWRRHHVKCFWVAFIVVFSLSISVSISLWKKGFWIILCNGYSFSKNGDSKIAINEITNNTTPKFQYALLVISTLFMAKKCLRNVVRKCNITNPKTTRNMWYLLRKWKV